MSRDSARRDRIQEALHARNLDGLVCALPANVLMLSGYWPVIGSGVVVVARDGPTVGLVPEDEQELASDSGLDEVRVFRPTSLERMQTTVEAIAPPLSALARDLSLAQRRIGYEGGEASEPASYSALHLYGASMAPLLEQAFARPQLNSATELLAGLRERKTPREVEGVRRACRLVARSFEAGAQQLQAGQRECEAAAFFRILLSAAGIGFEGAARAGGFTWCMSGPNSAKAHGAYARSRDRKIGREEFILVHCNSYADGYWTDVTRTFTLGAATDRQQRLYEAVFAARRAALETIRPGARAADVDRAAREVLRQRGLGKEFLHPTGHGVGFGAISPNARPRLHPHSPDLLEEGMVFNVEPAVYFEGYGGLRHCDLVAVTAQGAEVLTPFQAEPGQLVLS
jgi:Xaa-Pro aminopeptidase